MSTDLQQHLHEARLCLIENLVPPEILSHIFGLVIVDLNEQERSSTDVGFSLPREHRNFGILTDESGEDIKPKRIMPSQVRVSHVCRRWRRVALDTPELWCNLDFCHYPFEMMVGYLKRSGDHPIDIALDHSLTMKVSIYIMEAIARREVAQEGEPIESISLRASLIRSFIILFSNLTNVMNLVTPLSARWRSFYYSTSFEAFSKYVLEKLGTIQVPLLEQLDLHLYDPTVDPSPSKAGVDVPAFGGYAPRLSKASITGIYMNPNVLIAPSLRLLPLDVSKPPIQLSDLTVLRLEFYGISDMSYDSFIAILHCATKLHTLSLVNSGPVFLPDTVVKPLPLLNLRDLTLGRLGSEYVSRLMPLLFAPGLTRLSLDFRAEDGNMTSLVTALTKPITPPEYIMDSTALTHIGSDNSIRPTSLISHLTELILYGLVCDADTEQVLYRACPDLRWLYTDVRRVKVPFVEPIMFRSKLPGRTPLDKLEEWSVVGFSSESIVEVIQTRRRRKLPSLKRLQIDKRITVNAAELMILKAIVANVSFANLMQSRRDELDPRMGNVALEEDAAVEGN